jgi:chlorobactene glucosyltransferase
MDGLTIYLAAAGAFSACILINLLVNLLIFPRVEGRIRRGSAAAPCGNPARVSILVPARNEERNIARCVRSLIAQDYAQREIIVLDDHSTDGTAGELAQLRREHPEVQVIQGEALPHGWLGKNWACAQLVRRATGEWLLFTDADTEHAPHTLAAAMNAAQERHAALLTLWPRQVAVTWSEKLLLPWLHLLLLGFLPLILVNRWRHPSLAAACGQFLLWRREAYEHTGGHEAVRASIVEDVVLARRVIAAGQKLVNADGTRAVQTRMYQSFRELWEGFTKNLYTGFGQSPPIMLFFLGLLVGVFIAPWFVAGVLFATDSELGPCALGMVGVTLLLAALVAWRFKHSAWGVAGLLPGTILFVLLGANSWWRTASRRGVSWKGRAYRPEA